MWGLPGMPFPARDDEFPSKDQMADYLESYAQHFRLPVQTGVKVERLSKQGDSFVVEAGKKRFEAEQVVVAMANYQMPTNILRKTWIRASSNCILTTTAIRRNCRKEKYSWSVRAIQGRILELK